MGKLENNRSKLLECVRIKVIIYYKILGFSYFKNRTLFLKKCIKNEKIPKMKKYLNVPVKRN